MKKKKVVFDDLNGVPNNLVVESNFETVIFGVVSSPVENLLLQQGGSSSRSWVRFSEPWNHFYPLFQFR